MVPKVGWGGRFCEEIEALVEKCICRLLSQRRSFAAVEQALTDLRDYLEDLINGAPDHTLKLYPAYGRLKTAHVARKVSASELFFKP